MKVAMTIWNGRISPVFDVCREVMVFEIAGEAVVSSSRHSIEGGTDLDRVECISELGADVLVCGAVSLSLHRELESRGVQVVAFVAGDVDAVLAAFVAGRLSGGGFAMPGCGRRRRGMGRRRGRRRPGGC